VFRSLNLRQQDQDGRPTWQLTSPEARYDLRRRVAQALEPKGVIYRAGKPAYNLAATTGTVINDGEVILLEGRIRVERLGSDPMLIRASRVRWFPSRQRMEIDRHPEALDSHNRLTALYARFLFDSRQLELRGRPLLERWEKRVDPITAAQPRRDPAIVIRVARADWEPESGRLEARGPVLATRRPPGSAAGRPPQTLAGTGLLGNTIKQQYRLSGPVQIVDPADDATLLTRDLALDGRTRRIHTDQPFQGQRGTLRVEGRSLLVDGDRDTIRIPAGCALDRPGERLRAGSCTWNWTTGAIEAEGDLEFRRQANDQLTRGGRLRGRLGKDGELEVTAPGGRVFSQFRIPPGSEPAPRQPRQRQEPEPIRL
jgi:LPS export ABC transporter protein LptC